MGIILSIIGGIKSGEDYGKTGHYRPQTLTKVGLALFIVSFVAILATTTILSLSISHAESGEKRILFAVAASVPLLLIRLIYSSVYTFGNNLNFSSLTGSVTILLLMALLEEIAIVLIYEGVGLTLRKSTKQDLARGEQMTRSKVLRLMDRYLIGHTRSEYAKNDVETHGRELRSI